MWPGRHVAPVRHVVPANYVGGAETAYTFVMVAISCSYIGAAWALPGSAT